MPDSAPKPSRSPWQRFYAAVHSWRIRWYIKRTRQLPRPVISIGNLHWGGSGKTPLTAAIAAHLRDGGHRVCILSRGYRSKGRGIRVVSFGEGPLLGPTVAGDEPVQLAGDLPGVSVVVGRDRYEAGQHALERIQPAPEIFLLDDGFSHLSLFRDLDLLAFPSTDRYGGGRLLPTGRLREPLRACSRADAILLTGSRKGDSAADLSAGLERFGFSGRSFSSRTVVRPAHWTQPTRGRQLDSATRLVAVAAIARPDEFLRCAEESGLEIVNSVIFPDHHNYPPASLAKIESTVLAENAEGILTTAKDGVKLRGKLDVALAELPIRAEPEFGFWKWLDQELRRIVST